MVAALPPPPTLAGATVSAVCRGGGIPYPQAAIAAGGGVTWVACRDRGTIVRIRTADGRVTRTIALRGLRPWSLAVAAGRVWVIAREEPLLAEVDPLRGRVTRRIPLSDLPDAVAATGGSIWIGYEHTGAARVDVLTRKVRPVTAGDGVSAFASDGESVWIVSHRDNRIHRVARDGSVELLPGPLAPTSTASMSRSPQGHSGSRAAASIFCASTRRPEPSRRRPRSAPPESTSSRQAGSCSCRRTRRAARNAATRFCSRCRRSIRRTDA